MPALARGFENDTPGERKYRLWAFDKQQGLYGILGNTGNVKDSGIGQVKMKQQRFIEAG
ncbi:uncharacterized protein METZ01_LOCUS327440, partial [marine metagenome]